MSDDTFKPMAVLGAGSFGTALSLVLARNGIPIHLWGRDEDHLNEMARLKINARYLPNIPLPDNIHPVNNLTVALKEVDDVLIAVPSNAFLPLIKQIKPHLSAQNVFWVTKGLDPSSGEFLHKAIAEELGNRSYAVLSGPSFALEVAERLPTAVVIASENKDYAFALANKFNNDCFRVYTTQDIVGVQLGGVVKNILAVASGISDGLNLGSNARAALMTRGLAEMMRLGEAIGARRETLMGLAGCGDIILSCTDNQSRNRRFGLALAEGLTETQALQKVGQMVEAVYNVEQLCRLAQLQEVELPISEQVFRIMKQGVSPRQAVTKLFARSIKSE